MFYTDNWAYFHVPKTAGTNIWVKAEKQAGAQQGGKYSFERHNPVWYWEYKIPDLEKNREYFGTVRNPYTRFVSLWHYVTKGNVTLDQFASHESVDLYKWYDRIEDAEILWDMHTTQHQILGNRVKCFRIDAGPELIDLEQAMGISFTNTRTKQGEYDKPWQDYYDDDLAKRVYRIFEEDFDLYEYPKAYK